MNDCILHSSTLTQKKQNEIIKGLAVDVDIVQYFIGQNSILEKLILTNKKNNTINSHEIVLTLQEKI
ncbi:hypothetical protein DERP_008924 [Dermatophagoides pteronyssinus]|uniref:Uncharacterized protein n=1 Tax=Dermatophagoides pteronyssinus TaxID=6956 RepID=A0ABQ8JP45_DERPT|nr:hypothetical protein DERP_008924 [Dermatophagoides pteronyssinus]